METSNKHNQNEYSYLRRLPIDKLLELLALAPSLSDRPEDEAYVDALEEAIIEKENENHTGFFPDVDQQWEQFVAHYLPETDQAESEPEPAEHAISPQTTRHVPQKRVIQLRQAGRTILVAAAVICALAIMVTAQAAGVDVFGAMARWNQWRKTALCSTILRTRWATRLHGTPSCMSITSMVALGMISCGKL